MSNLYAITPPIKLFTDTEGLPLENGYVYIGNPNQDPKTFPKQVYWDAAGTIPASQPLRTISGYIANSGTPANIYIEGDHSITVEDSTEAQVVTSPTSVDQQLFASVTDTAAVDITAADAGGYYTAPDNVENILQQIGASLLSITAGALPTGTMLDYCGTTAPSGYVLASGRTIGNVASNATERNNADTSNLFVQLWNSSTNTELPIQDSAGSTTTRGVSAAADYAANKRLPLPDLRGRVRAGKDDMGGSTASRLTSGGAGIVGTTMFAAGGTQTHTLVSPGELPAHTHTQNAHTHTQDAHTHTQNSHNHTQDAHNHTQNVHNHSMPVGNIAGAVPSFTLTTAASGTANVADAQASNQASTATNQATTATNQNATATNQNTTAVNQSTGSGGAHQNTQPTVIFTVIIKL